MGKEREMRELVIGEKEGKKTGYTKERKGKDRYSKG